tara:strand:+ start:476 stop:2161 length:1686 start_codon:yes stop_codon:yes gene_type:complete
MSDDKDYTSLLGRSSGSSWGDIAGAYLSGGRKKDNRARNVLLASLFFNAKEANMQSKVLKQVEELKDSKALEIAKAEANFQKKLEIEALQDRITKEGEVVVFDTEAESWFNNPNNQADNFDPLDYEDRNSPMYTVKRKAKNKYINEVLLPRHNAKYGALDPSISTREEFIKPIQDKFKSQIKEASSSDKLSLIHKGLSAIGIGGSNNQEHIKEGERARKIIAKNNTKRTIEGIGYIFDDDFDDNYIKSNYLDIKKDGTEQKYIITEIELERGNKYSLNEFKRSEEYNTLQTAGAKKAAIQMFNDKMIKEEGSQYKGLLNDEHMLDIINTAKVTDILNNRTTIFEGLKNNDPEFLESKPKKDSYTDTQKFMSDIETWEAKRNEAYSPGGTKYLQARKDSGYMVTDIEKYEAQINQYINYSADVQQKREILTSDDGVFSKKDQEEWTAFKDNKIEGLLEKFAKAGLETPSEIGKSLSAIFEASIAETDSYLISAAGERAASTYKEAEENKGRIITIAEARNAIRSQRYTEITRIYNENRRRFGVTGEDIIYKTEEVDLNNIVK